MTDDETKTRALPAVRLTESLYNAVKRRAEDDNVSISAVVESALMRYLSAPDEIGRLSKPEAAIIKEYRSFPDELRRGLHRTVRGIGRFARSGPSRNTDTP